MHDYATSTTSTTEDLRGPMAMGPGKSTLVDAVYPQGAPATHETLRVGSTGAPVVELQQKLGIPADGQFGPQTRAAVVAFQQAHGLGADGVVGPQTWGALTGVALAAAPAAAAPAPSPAPAPTSTPASTTPAVAGPAHAGGGPPVEGLAPPGQAPQPAEGGVRGAIVAAARSKLGSVFSDVAAAADETGDKTRQGWETLTEIFAVAMPTFPKHIIKYIKYGKNNGKDGSSQNGLVSWCGIFATWAVLTGGGNCGTWDAGPRCSAMTKITSTPKPGDVGYFTANAHHCIIASVNGDQIETIDGNSYDGGSGGNGAITSRMRSRHDFAGFFKQVDD